MFYETYTQPLGDGINDIWIDCEIGTNVAISIGYSINEQCSPKMDALYDETKNDPGYLDFDISDFDVFFHNCPIKLDYATIEENDCCYYFDVIEKISDDDARHVKKWFLSIIKYLKKYNVIKSQYILYISA
jgi:hypothetical protein